MTAYYNEFDSYAAQWLRNLIKAGHIAPGIVDERSIEDVCPDDLKGFTQCHFFAGIGVWSLALRRAGWPDDRPVWTGSAPCQPFSAAGAGAGFADPRHLWPSFAWLIGQCRPPVVFGEQVASKAVEPWVDLVHADLEALEYAFGAVPFPSAGVGAPHIRDRLFWVADADYPGLEGRWESRRERGTERPARESLLASGMAYTNGWYSRAEREQRSGQQRQQPKDGSGLLGLGNADDTGQHSLLRAEQNYPVENLRRSATSGSLGRVAKRDESQPGGFRESYSESTGPVNGFWRDSDWLGCRDDKWRPVEPGTFPLAHGAPSRVGRLRAYGNAINAEAAHEFISAYLA